MASSNSRSSSRPRSNPPSPPAPPTPAVQPTPPTPAVQPTPPTPADTNPIPRPINPRIFRPRLIATIYTSVVLQVFLYSVATHFFWEANAPYLISPKKQEAQAIDELVEQVDEELRQVVPF